MMVLANIWTTKQVDYNNAFTQVEIEKEIYVEQPMGFKNMKDRVSKVLKLSKRLYGLK